MTKLIISTSENPEKEITRLMIEIDILEKRIEELNNMINKLDKVIVMKNKEKNIYYIFSQ